MNYIDPHIHMVSRTTDDYKRMALAGCVMVSEPAFWAGFDRSARKAFATTSASSPSSSPNARPPTASNTAPGSASTPRRPRTSPLAREVIALIPEFIDQPGVLGIGEIGLNKNTRNEATVFAEHLELAAQLGELVLVHTPHLEDKYKGTRMILDMLRDDQSRIAPQRVCIDHVEEHTIRLALDAGHWAGMTLYPITKCTPARAADMVEAHGTDRLMVNSAGDWGHSDPLAVPEFIFEMRRRGHEEATIRKVVLRKPARILRPVQPFQLRRTPRFHPGERLARNDGRG